MRASRSCHAFGPAAAAIAALLAASASAAEDAGPPLERPADIAAEPALPIPRPTAPATEGETEVQIEAEAQPEDPPDLIEPEPAADPAPEADLPGPLPRPDDAATGEPSHPEPGWTLRQATGSSPVALGGGPGQVVSVAAFCLGGSPWLALELDPAPEAASIRADFGFTGTRVEAEALREDGAGGAYVIELADSPLAGLLAGSDSVAALGLDGTQQGPLSLAGSTRVIRAALEDCHAF
jgi:hypothetical protein